MITEAGWSAISEPYKRVTISYGMLFNDGSPRQYYERETISLPNNEITEERILRYLQSGWVSTPTIDNLKILSIR